MRKRARTFKIEDRLFSLSSRTSPAAKEEEREAENQKSLRDSAGNKVRCRFGRLQRRRNPERALPSHQSSPFRPLCGGQPPHWNQTETDSSASVLCLSFVFLFPPSARACSQKGLTKRSRSGREFKHSRSTENVGRY